MEIGEQHIHHLKPVARRDKNICFAGARLQHSALCGTFQRTQTGGTDCNHPAAPRPGLFNRVDRSLRNNIAFAVHCMVCHMLNAHRLKSARSHMQGDISCVNTLLAQGGEHRLIEMQSRSGRGYRARLSCEYGLITAVILCIGAVRNIGRQGQAAIFFQQTADLFFSLKTQVIKLTHPPQHCGLDTPGQQ